ncbi:hypothetical protein N7512_003031 [Penicillium capsulatum]|nr:hypothetical protein N7512_003031 [Penicillium capsulatum]
MPRSKEGFLWTQSHTQNGLKTDAVIPSSADIKPFYDVVVIGGGFAGLIAARNLALSVKDSRWVGCGCTSPSRICTTKLHGRGLHWFLKSSAGTSVPENQYFKPAQGGICEVPLQEVGSILERVGAESFTVDGLDSRALMPFPHDPFREPALWRQYDHLTVKQRLDQLSNFSDFEKSLFESDVNTFGSAPGSETGFTEALCWFTLGGHSMVRVFEKAGIFKLGHGGMTAIARGILDDFKGDIVLSTVVESIDEGRQGITLRTRDGQSIDAKAVISTILLCVLSQYRVASSIDKKQELSRRYDVQSTTQLTPTRSHKCRTHQQGREDPFQAGCYRARLICNVRWERDIAISIRVLRPQRDSTVSSRDMVYWIRADYSRIAGKYSARWRYTGYLTHDWMNDPFAKGTWCCWGPNKFSHFVPELQKPHGRVFFASADWADGWRGFVDGAIESGQKAANDARVGMKF